MMKSKNRSLLRLLVMCIITIGTLAGCQSTESHSRVTQEIPVLPSDLSIWRDRVVVHAVIFDYGVLENTPYVSYKNGSDLMCHVRSIHIDGTIEDFYLEPYEATNRQWLDFASQVGSVSVICENLASN